MNKIRESNREITLLFLRTPGKTSSAEYVIVSKENIVDDNEGPMRGLAITYHVFLTLMLIATIISIILGSKTAIVFWNFYSTQ